MKELEKTPPAAFLEHPAFDWKGLRELAAATRGCAGVAEMVCRQGETPPDMRLSLWTGDANGALGLLLEDWLGEGVAAAAREAGTRPLLVRGPSGVQDVLAGQAEGWREVAAPSLPAGQALVVLGRPGGIRAEQEARLMALGRLPQAIVVTRFSQLLPQAEREDLATVARLAARTTVLAVLLAGEQAGPDDYAKVLQRGLGLLEKEGLDGPRRAGVRAWVTTAASAAAAEHPLRLATPADALEKDASVLDKALAAARQAAVEGLLTQIEAEATASALTAPPPLAQEQQQEILSGFARSMEDFQAQLAARLDSYGTAEDLRAEMQVWTREWSRQGAAPGADAALMLVLANMRTRLAYAEKLRPGFTATVQAAALQAVARLDLPARGAATGPAQPGGGGELRRRAGILAGFVLGGGVIGGLPGIFVPLVGGVLQSLGMMVGAVLGYIAAGWYLARTAQLRRTGGSTAQTSALALPGAGSVSSIPGFADFSQAVDTAVRAALGSASGSLTTRCEAFRTRLARA